MSVSLIATLKNEQRHLDKWLDGIERQVRLPDEIVIVDGGSKDGTWESLHQWAAPCPVTLLQVPGVSISAGRNIAMAHASREIMAITDGGTVAAPDWLDLLLKPFEDPTTDVVSGFFEPDQSTVWNRSLAAATLPDVGEIDGRSFLPSSRSVAVRSRWVRRGFEYPEWLDYCEDLVWDLQLRNAGARFRFVPDAIVTFVVRPSWKSFFSQYFRYARGDGKAGLFGKRHIIRYGTYAGGLAVAMRRNRIELSLAALLAGLYVSRPVYRLVRRDHSQRVPVPSTLVAGALIPIHRLVGDIAKMLGYPVGMMWRLRRFGTLSPWKNWRRITTAGDLWNPGSPSEEIQRQED